MEAMELREMKNDILEHTRIRKEEVLTDLRHIKLDSSPELDQEYPWEIWEGIEEISGPIAEITLASQEVMEDWRVANVPLFKKGCEDKPMNDRPVSLILVVGKLLKTILRTGITSI